MKIFSMLLTVLLAASTLVYAETEPTGKQPSSDAFNPNGFYTFRPDLRKCVSPLCGGIFVKEVNRKQTRCADGSLQQECYVATVINKQAFDITEAALVQGKLLPKNYPGFGNLGEFVLTSAARSVTDKTVTWRFVGLENNGIVCITTPCFSVDEYSLNSVKIKEISEIDLESVGANKEDLQQAQDIIAGGGVLLAAGINEQVQQQTGLGVKFVAEQFYLPIKPLTN
ncbi:MAG: hypothetical protein Q7U57_11395 [Methylovulum sp.]|nr:hypothetical protein [Methylovulum sp.]